MTISLRRRAVKTLAVALVAALILTTPGGRCYEAIAGTFQSTPGGQASSGAKGDASREVPQLGAALPATPGGEAAPTLGVSGSEQGTRIGERAAGSASLAESGESTSQPETTPRTGEAGALETAKETDSKLAQAPEGAEALDVTFDNSRKGDSPTPPPATPKRQTLWSVLALGGLGAFGARLAAPKLVPVALAAASSHGLSSAVTAAAQHPSLFHWAVIGLGALLGVAASQRDTWRGFPRALWRTSKAGAIDFQFDFWAMTGMVIHGVATGKIFKRDPNKRFSFDIRAYPLIAKPFVLVGTGLPFAAAVAAALVMGWTLPVWAWAAGALIFGGAPVGFLLGFLYKATTTPAVAAWRGVKQIALEFFPWLKDFIENAFKALIEFPLAFVAGFAIGEGKGALASGLALSRPFRRAMASAKGPTTSGVLETFLLFATYAAGYVASAVSFVVGAAIGLVVSPVSALTRGLSLALDVTDWDANKVGRGLDLWKTNAERLDQRSRNLVGALDFYGPNDSDSREPDFGDVITRLSNAPAASAATAVVLPAQRIAAYVQAWARKAPAVSDFSVLTENGGIEDMKPAKPTPDPKFLVPFLVFSVGSAAAFVGLFALGLSFIPGGLLGLAVLGLLALPGGFAALVLTRLSDLKTIPANVKTSHSRRAADARKAWARLGLNADAAIRGSARDAALFTQAPTSLKRYPILALPFAAFGYVAALGSAVLGGAVAVAGPVFRASWTAFVDMARAAGPFVRRILRGIRWLIVHSVPFAFGMLFGSIAGLFQTAYVGAKTATGPLSSIYVRDIGELDDGWSKAGVGLLRLALAPVWLATAVLGLAAGVVVGLPSTALLGLSLGARWGKMPGRAGKFFRIWRLESSKLAAGNVERLGDAISTDKPLGLRQYLLNAPNALGLTLVALSAGALAAFSAQGNGIDEALLLSKTREGQATLYDIAEKLNYELREKIPTLRYVSTSVSDSSPGLYKAAVVAKFETQADLDAAVKAGTLPKEVQGIPVVGYVKSAAAAVSDEQPQAEPPAASQPQRWPIGVVALIGAVALIAGAAAGWAVAVPVLGLALWKAAAIVAAGAVATAALGLAASQPSMWKELLPETKSGALEGWNSARAAWSREGRRLWRVAAAAPDAADGKPLKLSAIPGALTAVDGAVLGAMTAPARGASRAVTQIVDEFLPWAKNILRELGKLAARAGSFVGGMLVGFVTGIVGSAVFGALVAGGPWFSYLVRPEIESGPLPKKIGKAILKIASSILGVAFGTAGLVVGVVVALPFALGMTGSMAVQFADTNGPIHRFADLWSKVRLRQELYLLSSVRRLQFTEPPAGKALPLEEAWGRFLNVGINTFLAPFLLLFLGLWGFGRSTFRAIQDTRAGRTVPAGADFDSVSPAFKTAATAAHKMARVGWWVGLAGGGYGYWFRSLPWYEALFVAPAGWLAGGILGGIVGGTVGLIKWLSVQLSKEPLEPGAPPAPKPTAPETPASTTAK